MSNHRTHSKKTALLLLGVVCLWQLGALVHLLTVSHEVCPHGKVVDEHHGGHHAQAPRRSDRGSGTPKEHPNHDNCRLLSSLTSANVTPNWIQPAIQGLPVFTLSAVFLPESQPFRATALYLTSPCHSPPRFV